MIVEEILRHAQRKPQHLALIIDDFAFSWAQLADEIQTRSCRNNQQQFQKSLEYLPTVNPESSVRDQALDALSALVRPDGDRSKDGVIASLKTFVPENLPPIYGRTSGSTANAKIYQRTQASWIASFSAEALEFDIREADVILAPGALSHSLFFYALCRGLFAGATVILSHRFRPDRVFDAITHHRATVLYSVPTQLKMLMQEIERTIRRAPNAGLDKAQDVVQHAVPYLAGNSLRLILSSGAHWFSELTAPLAQHFPNAEIIEFYGASETSFITAARHRSDAALPTGSVGKAFHGVNISVRNSQLKICAPGEIGGVFVHSAAAFDHYLGPQPADFSEFHDQSGRRWLSVGDQGYLDSDGYLFLVGRSARKIIVSGKNLYPEEVEQALETHPVIARAAVVGRQDARRGEHLVAAIQLSQNAKPLTRAELIDFLRPVIEDYKIPRRFRVLSTWPITSAGKTDFSAIAKIVANNDARPDQLDLSP